MPQIEIPANLILPLVSYLEDLFSQLDSEKDLTGYNVVVELVKTVEVQEPPIKEFGFFDGTKFDT